MIAIIQNINTIPVTKNATSQANKPEKCAKRIIDIIVRNFGKMQLSDMFEKLKPDLFYLRLVGYSEIKNFENEIVKHSINEYISAKMQENIPLYREISEVIELLLDVSAQQTHAPEFKNEIDNLLKSNIDYTNFIALQHVYNGKYSDLIISLTDNSLYLEFLFIVSDFVKRELLLLNETTENELISEFDKAAVLYGSLAQFLDVFKVQKENRLSRNIKIKTASMQLPNLSLSEKESIKNYILNVG